METNAVTGDIVKILLLLLLLLDLVRIYCTLHIDVQLPIADSTTVHVAVTGFAIKTHTCIRHECIWHGVKTCQHKYKCNQKDLIYIQWWYLCPFSLVTNVTNSKIDQ